MYSIDIKNSFKKDYKLALKRGLDEDKLEEALKLLRKDGKLPAKYKPHVLKGRYKGLWECHIQSDWLLIWDQQDTIRLITLIRTGTHSDLF
ncbi:MAG: type II toxin-antitoxin system YafQ family toxin [Flavobacteriaceae bacterium]|jgi:mRNA interferase YafQ|nr:type II toxin-antitoxin system YafQ family toxin [Flavobacteriaceae bacterium]